jgi:hypothetical protein
MGNSHKRIWLASFPKCGNTWFRIFLANLVGTQDAEKETDESCCDINHINTGGISSSRPQFDRFYGIDSLLLNQTEVEQRQPEVFESNAFESNDIKRFTKAHDAYRLIKKDAPLLGNPSYQAAIYLVRNPLDTVPSYANHWSSTDLDMIISKMANEQEIAHQSQSQLLQYVSSWSQHVDSWLEQADMPIFLMRYEDMVTDTFNTFKNALEFSGVECTDEAIQLAIEQSSFDKLKAAEKKDGFRESPRETTSFFRQGKIGSYREVLSDTQIETVVEQHRKVMEKLGYLKEGELVF